MRTHGRKKEPGECQEDACSLGEGQKCECLLDMRGMERGTQVRQEGRREATTARSWCSAQDFALYPIGEWVNGDMVNKCFLNISMKE